MQASSSQTNFRGSMLISASVCIFTISIDVSLPFVFNFRLRFGGIVYIISFVPIYMQMKKRSLPRDGWIHQCFSCKTPTAKTLRWFLVTRASYTDSVPCCQRCYQKKCYIGKQTKYNFYIHKKIRYNSLQNIILCW